MATYDGDVRKEVLLRGKEGKTYTIRDADEMVNAAYDGDVSKVKAWLERGVDVNHIVIDDGTTALRLASQQGNMEVVKVLLAEDDVEVDFCPDATGGTALLFAVMKGHIDIVRALLTKGASIDQPEALGQTPLMYACIFEQEEIVKLLLDKGASINLQAKDGKTALDHAKTPTIRNMLIEAGATE